MVSDAELIRTVLRGDRAEFAVLVARYERMVWATAWRVLKDDHAAADVGQEAFLQAYQRLGDLRDPEQFGVWLLRIVRRESVRLAKQRKRDEVREHTGEQQATSLPAESEELVEAVAGLPEHERQVVVLRYLHGYAVAEIAQALGRPVGTVTKHLSRAVQRLKQVYKGVIR